MSYTCLLMVLYECACANLISKANFNLIDKTDVLICLHIMFQISFQTYKGQKSYRKILGVRSELLLSIYCHIPSITQLVLSNGLHSGFTSLTKLTFNLEYCRYVYVNRSIELGQPYPSFSFGKVHRRKHDRKLCLEAIFPTAYP